MEFDVEFTDEFRTWWNTLSVEEQTSIDAAVRLLERLGPGIRTAPESRRANTPTCGS